MITIKLKTFQSHYIYNGWFAWYSYSIFYQCINVSSDYFMQVFHLCSYTKACIYYISLSNQFNSSQVMSVNVKLLLDSIFIITTNIFNDFVRFTYKYASYLSIQQRKKWRRSVNWRWNIKCATNHCSLVLVLEITKFNESVQLHWIQKYIFVWYVSNCVCIQSTFSSNTSSNRHLFFFLSRRHMHNNSMLDSKQKPFCNVITLFSKMCKFSYQKL